MKKLIAALCLLCLPALATSLYWKNDSADNSWNNVINWHTDAAATVQAANVPWVSGDSTYLAYDLEYATDETGTVIGDAAVLGTATGTCSMVVSFAEPVAGGTWTGEMSSFQSVSGGTFAGGWSSVFAYLDGGAFPLEGIFCSAYVTAGTFSGFVGSFAGNIVWGAFSGVAFNFTGNIIYGGVYTGSAFFLSGVTVQGGLFNVASSLTLDSSCCVYGGIWSNSSPTIQCSDSYIYEGTFWLSSGSLKLNGTVYRALGAMPAEFEAELKTSDILGSGLQ